jgi:hypothetical protein
MTKCKDCIHEQACAAWIRHGETLYDDFEYDVENCPYYASTENTVPVDEIKFHHMLIDKDGIPEVKLQFGDRILVLRRENDPVEIVEVVHGQWNRKKHRLFGLTYDYVCSACGCDYAIAEYTYCPNCGARMDGGK